MPHRSLPYLLAGGALVAGGLVTAASSLEIVVQTSSGSSLADSTIYYDVLRYDPWLILAAILLMIGAGFALYRAGRYAPRPPGDRGRAALPGSDGARRAAGLIAGGLFLLWSVDWALGSLALAGATFSVGSGPPAGHLVLVPLWTGGAITTAVAGSGCIYLAGRWSRPVRSVDPARAAPRAVA